MMTLWEMDRNSVPDVRMSSTMSSELNEALDEIGLGTLYQNFADQKIDASLVNSLTDAELSNLGISTIGDRARLRESLRRRSRLRAALPDNRDGSAHGSASLASQIENERSLLFGRSTSRPRKKQKVKNNRTWTGTFVCLANRHQVKVPTAAEKTVLFKAGMGLKKIKFNTEEKVDQVMEKLTSESEGFGQLASAGGFELMRCQQNCRDLVLIDCPWNVSDLRNQIGSQTKIYLRPIQVNLSTVPIVPDVEEQKKEICKGCLQNINILELRNHIRYCSVLNSESDSELVQIPNRDEVDEELHETINANEEREDDSNNQQEVEEDATEHHASIELETEDKNDSNLSAEVGYVEYQTDAEEKRDPHVVNLSTVEDLDSVIETVISFIKSNNIQDPVDILRYAQDRIVTGRQLDITDVSTTLEGTTNFIMIDRFNLSTTAFEEIESLPDLRPTLSVQFYGEMAEDFGGPRKEFFRLILSEIKDNYFEGGFRPLAETTYEIIGKIFALSILQNGKIPQFMDEKVINELFSTSDTGISPVIRRLRQGMDSLGLYRIGSQLPMFLHIFRPTSNNLTFRRLTTMLVPTFHENGSNVRKYENEIYAEFLKYAREAASGRRGSVTLQSILMFTTSADEEPALGFAVSPSISFIESNTFLPTANTCINCLYLPRPSQQNPMPNRDILFSKFDYAFTSTFYGLV